MENAVRFAVLGFLVFLTILCARRQRRYWREIMESRLSSSLKAGYSIATISIAATLALAVVTNTPTMWNNFVTVVAISFMFCLKITFSPAVIAATIALSSLQLFINDTFPFLEIWTAFISILTWRLPEEVRACYAYFSFAWILLVLLFPSSAELDDSLENVEEIVNI
jgi:hypothetical protein